MFFKVALVLVALALSLASGGAAASGDTCAAGLVQDDGTVETGYGFVPSATYGIYVQEVRAEELPRRALARVCVCWLKTRFESAVDFQVVFYADAGGVPAAEPYATVPATATDVPRSVAAAGRFYPVDVSGVLLREGLSYVGVRWNPAAARFLFVCTDTSPETEKVNAFFQEERAPRWTSVFQARDPIFRPHRSILVRVEAAAAEAGGLIRGRAASSTPQVSPPGSPRSP